MLITRRAASDLEGIAVFTLEQWGEAQMEVYLSNLADRFSWLADHPLVGRPRDDIRPGIRSFREGSHVVYYRAVSDRIEIIGVLHQSRDVTADLKNTP